MRNGGRGIAFAKCIMVGFVSRAPLRLAEFVTELVVTQLGAFTSVMVKIGFGVKYDGNSGGSKAR